MAKLSAIPKARALDSRWRVSPILQGSIQRKYHSPGEVEHEITQVRVEGRVPPCKGAQILPRCPGAGEVIFHKEFSLPLHV